MLKRLAQILAIALIALTNSPRAFGQVGIQIFNSPSNVEIQTNRTATLQGPPTVTGIVPSSWPIGSNVSGSILGTNMTNVSSVTFSGTGVTATLGSAGTGTSAGINITVAADAELGLRTVTAVTPGGTSNAFSGFTVTRAPLLSNISPNAGALGSTVSATITGTHLDGATAVTVSGVGVTATVASGGTSTSLPVTIVIAAGSATGSRNVTVTTPYGVSPIPLVFNVSGTLAPPTITSISPTSLSIGGQVAASITGTNLIGYPSVFFSGTGVTASLGTGAATGTAMYPTITVARDAPLGLRTVTVATAGGTSNVFSGFSVTRGPLIDGLTPNVAPSSGIVSATITGVYLEGATAVTISGTGVTAEIKSGGTSTSLPITIFIAPDAPSGIRMVNVTTPDGVSPGMSFWVKSAVITSLTPSSFSRGTTVPAVLGGLNLGNVVSFNAGSGITVTIGSGSNTSLPLTIAVDANAAVGLRAVSVSTPSGPSPLFYDFAITSVPTVTSINPPSGTTGQTLTAVISGTNLESASSISFAGTGVTATIGSNGSAILAFITIAPGTISGNYPFRVTTSGGQTSPFDFFVTGGLPPTIDSLSVNPPGISQVIAPYYGRPVSLTIRGHNFGPGYVAMNGTFPLPTTYVSETELTTVIPTSRLFPQLPFTIAVRSMDNQYSNVVELQIVERGDINGNSSLTIGDALVCALNVGGVTKPLLPISVGDMNLNGTVNIGDCLVIALFTGRINPNLNTPTISSVTPPAAPRGSTITINGNGFAPDFANHEVLFRVTDGFVRVKPDSGSTTSLAVNVPWDAVSGPIQVYRLDAPMGSSEFPFFVSGTPTALALTTISPFYNVARGSSVTLIGMGFSGTLASNTVTFKGASGAVGATVTAGSTSSLIVTVPNEAICGPVTVSANGQTSKPRMVTVLGTECAFQIADVIGNAQPGETMVIEGAGFDTVKPSNNIALFPGPNLTTLNAATLQTGATQLHVRVPDNAINGQLVLNGPNAVASNSISWATPSTSPPSVSVFISSDLPVGAYQVTIGYDKNLLQLSPSSVYGGAGAGFTNGPAAVNVNNVLGTVTLNAFQTTASPTGTFSVARLAFTPIATGISPLSITVNALTRTDSTDLPHPPAQVFLSVNSVRAVRVDQTVPVLSSLSAARANRGAVLTLTGSGFSEIATENIVVFAGTSGVVEALASSGSTTSLTVTIPQTAISGPVRGRKNVAISEPRILEVLGSSGFLLQNAVTVSAGQSTSADIYVPPPTAGLNATAAGIFDVGASDFFYSSTRAIVDRGATKELAVAGTGISQANGSTLTIDGGGVTVSNVRFATSGGTTFIIVRISVAVDAPTGARNVVITNSNLDRTIFSGGLFIR